MAVPDFQSAEAEALEIAGARPIGCYDIGHEQAVLRDHLCRRRRPEGGYLALALGHDIFTETDIPDGLHETCRDRSSPRLCANMRREA